MFVQDVPLLDFRSIELGSVLGKGATSTAFRSTFNGKSYAAKVLKTEDDFGRPMPSGTDETLQAELLALSKLGAHPNVVQFYGVCSDSESNPMIVLELVEGKDLERYLSQLKPGFDLGRATIQKWSLDLMSALDFLHNRDPMIVHCDVKPANLLVTPCRTSLKLTDFGIAKLLDRERRLSRPLKANEGSPRYRAPEVLSSTGVASFTEKADIYSAGMVVHYLLTGRRPESDTAADPRSRPSLAVARLRWRGAADVVERMWAHDAERRPTAGECAAVIRSLGRADEEEEEEPAVPRGCYAGIRWPSARQRLVA